MPGASLSDVVSVRQWLSSAGDVRACVEVRSGFIARKPAALGGVIPGLFRPDFLIERGPIMLLLFATDPPPDPGRRVRMPPDYTV